MAGKRKRLPGVLKKGFRKCRVSTVNVRPSSQSSRYFWREFSSEKDGAELVAPMWGKGLVQLTSYRPEHRWRSAPNTIAAMCQGYIDYPGGNVLPERHCWVCRLCRLTLKSLSQNIQLKKFNCFLKISCFLSSFIGGIPSCLYQRTNEYFSVCGGCCLQK